jgi:inositol-pentakisphosphate 2-kinase
MSIVSYSESPSKRIYLATEADSQQSATLEYLAEGNANIVYSFRPIANDVLPFGVHQKLLRLRKDKSFIQSTKSQAATFQLEFVPLFRPENLVEQKLVLLDEALIRRLNRELEEHESSVLRQNMRHGDQLATDSYGLLMTDMTARHGEYLFEIKPKWLLQSPDAPGDSIRCRTCALRLQRTHAKAQSAVTPKPGGFCPLSLVDDDIEERQKAFKSIIEAQAVNLPKSSGKSTIRSSTEPIRCTRDLHLTSIDSTSVGTVVKFLAEKGYLVLKTLREHQAHFDKHGLLNLGL